jgi:hypothetical protein
MADTVSFVSQEERERADYLSRLRWQMDRDYEIAMVKEAKAKADLYWQTIIAEKDRLIAEADARIAEINSKIAANDA